MSVVATPSVHALLRHLVANSPRRHFLHDTEGIELSNQAALVRDVVRTIEGCLDPALTRLRASQRDAHDADRSWADGDGPRLLMATAQYDDVLGTLLDAASVMDSGRMGTGWTLLGAAAGRLHVLAALASATGADVARGLTATSARARAHLAEAAAAGTTDADLYPTGTPDVVARESHSPTLPEPERAVADLMRTIELGAVSGRDGGPLSTLLDPVRRDDYANLAMTGAHQVRVALEIARVATDHLCTIAAAVTDDPAWTAWVDDVHAAVDFAGVCL